MNSPYMYVRVGRKSSKKGSRKVMVVVRSVERALPMASYSTTGRESMGYNYTVTIRVVQLPGMQL